MESGRSGRGSDRPAPRCHRHHLIHLEVSQYNQTTQENTYLNARRLFERRGDMNACAVGKVSTSIERNITE